MQALRRSIGVAYQDFKLLPEKTVAQNIAFSMEVAYRSKAFIRQQTRKLLSQLALSDKVNTRAGKLSRGEQQRVAIARAVANEPVLILADEPTGNLDPETTELVMELFHEYNEKGTTLLIATHDHSIYNYPGSKVVTIEQGQVTIATGTDDMNGSNDKQPKAHNSPSSEKFSEKTSQESSREEDLYQQMVIKEGLAAVMGKGAEV